MPSGAGVGCEFAASELGLVVVREVPPLGLLVGDVVEAVGRAVGLLVRAISFGDGGRYVPRSQKEQIVAASF